MGPVAIAQLSGESAQLGWIPLLSLMAAISLNLGLLNLLPIPILDGGHILIMALEGVARRDFSVQREGEDAAGRLRGPDDADGDGHLQRSGPNQLDREPHALALTLHSTRVEVLVNSTKLVGSTGMAVLLALVIAGLGGSAAAQDNVSSAEIQRLQDSIYDASRDVSQLRVPRRIGRRASSRASSTTPAMRAFI